MLRRRCRLRTRLPIAGSVSRRSLEREERLHVLSRHLVPSQCGAALALAQLGDATAAVRYAELAMHSARAWGAPRTVAQALRVRARLKSTEDAVATLSQAAELLETSPARLDEAWVR